MQQVMKVNTSFMMSMSAFTVFITRYVISSILRTLLFEKLKKCFPAFIIFVCFEPNNTNWIIIANLSVCVPSLDVEEMIRVHINSAADKKQCIG